MASYEEYLDYLKANVSQLERLGDSFSGADDRLDYAVKELLAIRPAIETLSSLITELKEAGFVMPLMTQQIVFQQTLQPNQGIRLEDLVPLDGAIVSVTMHFPFNCNGNVDVAFGHGYKQICPISGFIALNDACPVFPTHETCKREETIWCVIDNHDGGAAHTIACIATIEGS